jgi:hypothetical protein
VHRRNSRENFLVVELKKSNNPEGDDRDIEKLRGFRRQLGYRHALFVRFSVGAPVAAVQTAGFVD